MKFLATVLFALSTPLLAIPSGGSSTGGGGSGGGGGSITGSGTDLNGSGNGRTAVTLDPLVASAVPGTGSCKTADYVITGCGVQASTLQQGVTFCFKKLNYLLLCTQDATLPFCSAPSYGSNILTVAATSGLASQCSSNAPYYGAFTTSF